METWKHRENHPKLVLRFVGQNQCTNHILYTAYGWLLQSTLRFKGYSLLQFTANMRTHSYTHKHDVHMLGVESKIQTSKIAGEKALFLK